MDFDALFVIYVATSYFIYTSQSSVFTVEPREDVIQAASEVLASVVLKNCVKRLLSHLPVVSHLPVDDCNKKSDRPGTRTQNL